MSAASEPVRWMRPAALLLFLGLPCLLAALTLANLVRWAQARDEQAEIAARVAEIEQRVRASAAARPTALDTGRIYLGASVATLARAELQTRVVDLVERSGARLIEVRADEEAPADQPGGVVVRATFDTVQERLADLLAAVEGGLPLLGVAGLDVRFSREREAAAPTEDPPLRVALAVRGIRRMERR